MSDLIEVERMKRGRGRLKITLWPTPISLLKILGVPQNFGTKHMLLLNFHIVPTLRPLLPQICSYMFVAKIECKCCLKILDYNV